MVTVGASLLGLLAPLTRCRPLVLGALATLGLALLYLLDPFYGSEASPIKNEVDRAGILSPMPRQDATSVVIWCDRCPPRLSGLTDGRPENCFLLPCTWDGRKPTAI